MRAEVLAARERGVIFDVGHGMGSFSFDVARRMLDQGFAPDTISSDIHALCIDGPAFDQVTTLSKFLALGMALPEVIRRSTQTPAAALRRPDLGTLAVGAPGEVAVMRVEDGVFDYGDTIGQRITGSQKITVAGIVLNGAWWHPR